MSLCSFVQEEEVMGRTPNYDLTTLPKWAQQLIADQNELNENLILEVDELNGYLDNMEAALEHMAKVQETEIEPGTSIYTVDL
jgi:hypothetical protein